jgi:hypothetical protein
MPAESGRSTTATPRRFFMPTLVAVGVSLLAFAWLSHINPEFPITDDGVRDQLMARDCVELGCCSLIGPATSVPGFYQGAVWLDVLIAVRLAGGNEATARTVVLSLLAAGIGTVFVIVWRWLRPSIAFPAALILLAGLGLDPYPSLLINPSAAAFPDILAAAGLLCYGLSGKNRFAILAAFAVGLAINVHVGSLSLVPSLVAVVALGSRRPLRGLLVALGVLFATYFVTSRAAMLANVDGLASHSRLLPGLAGETAILLLSVWLGPRFRRLPWEARAWLIGVILIAPFGAGLLWLIVWQRHGFGLTYLHPVLAPAAALAAALVSTPFELVTWRRKALRWVPTAAALAGFASIAVLVAGTSRATDPGYWTLADATAIANQAWKMGWSYEQLVFRVQSTACRDLLVGMSVEAAAPTTGAPGQGRAQLQVLRTTRNRLAALPAALDVVSLETGEAAIVRTVESWLQPEALVACHVPIGPTAPVCAPARGGRSEPGGPFLFGTRSFPEIHNISLPPPYVARYEIPLGPVSGERRDVVLTDNSLPTCGWNIMRAEGVRIESQLPAQRARLYSDTGAPGLLVIERPFGTPACASDILDDRYPPCLLETQPDDPLRALVEGH